jgi:hypothetical protein
MMVGIGDSHDRLHLISDLLLLACSGTYPYILSVLLMRNHHQVDLVRGVRGKKGIG